MPLTRAEPPSREQSPPLAVADLLHEAEVIRSSAVVEVREVSRLFGSKVALDRVSFTACAGEIHAVLGPNGAGKTTLLRILSGLLEPSVGDVRVLGMDASAAPRLLRQEIGLVPSGDRSFYLRISGLENLVFFARLQGMRRVEAQARARDVLALVGLLDSAEMRVGFYSHGMQKRLSIARALLTDPAVLIVDEGTHDLDPARARDVRDLVRVAADTRGVTVIWATQRLDEIRGFADRATLLDLGQVRFDGTVSGLIARAAPRRYVLRLAHGSVAGEALLPVLGRALAGIATISWSRTDRDDFVLSLGSDIALGTALHALLDADVQLLACREERSEIEGAFLSLTGEPLS